LSEGYKFQSTQDFTTIDFRLTTEFSANCSMIVDKLALPPEISNGRGERRLGKGCIVILRHKSEDRRSIPGFREGNGRWRIQALTDEIAAVAHSRLPKEIVHVTLRFLALRPIQGLQRPTISPRLGWDKT
jgi:hypothetical protein